MLRRLVQWCGYRRGLKRGLATGVRLGRASAHEAGYADGYKAGNAEGIRDGVQQGRVVGRQEAYTTAAIQLGVLRPCPATQPLPPESHGLQVNAHHPNVYLGGDRGPTYNRWIVRVLKDQHVHRRSFAFNQHDNNYRIRSLVDALRWRDQFESDHKLSVVWDDCRASLRGENSPEDTLSTTAAMYVALEFHRRMLVCDITVEHASWVGDDPRDRFPLSDPNLMLEPWPNLYPRGRVPGPVVTGCQAVGLGAPESPRTVRDLLLVTGEELTNVYGFGDKSLRQLRAHLATKHLALWGDPVPGRQANTRHHIRRLQFDNSR